MQPSKHPGRVQAGSHTFREAGILPPTLTVLFPSKKQLLKSCHRAFLPPDGSSFAFLLLFRPFTPTDQL